MRRYDSFSLNRAPKTFSYCEQYTWNKLEDKSVTQYYSRVDVTTGTNDDHNVITALD